MKRNEFLTENMEKEITLIVCPNCGVHHDKECADCPCCGYNRFEEDAIGNLPL